MVFDNTPCCQHDDGFRSRDPDPYRTGTPGEDERRRLYRHVKAGDHVKKGDLLLEVDLEKVKAAGYDTITPVIVCNTPDYSSVENVGKGAVNAGDDLIIVS